MGSTIRILGAGRSRLWLCTRMCHPSVVHRVVGVEAMEALTRVIRLTRTVVVDNTQDVEVMAVDADTAMVVAIGATSQVMVMGITAFSKRRRHLAFRSWFRSLDHCDTHWAAYE
jgi:hypothetical protein